MFHSRLVLALATSSSLSNSNIGGVKRQVASSAAGTPQVFQTVPELFAGPTTTGLPPFMAETNTILPDSTNSYVPNNPLETSQPIPDNSQHKNIFQLLGNQSPYFPNPVGFGVDEYPLPEGASITQVHALLRHGARYPNITTGAETIAFGERLNNASGTLKAKGDLSFLNTYKYQLGAEIQTAWGRQEMFDSGVYHFYQYGKLYNTSTKIIARTTSQDRMLQATEYFLAGFFGLDWTQNATIEVNIEELGFNTSLSSFLICNNSRDLNTVNSGGPQASNHWNAIYLADATKRFQSQITGYNWTLRDTVAAQTLCPYDTYAYSYSPWCGVFTEKEWEGYEYSIDLGYAGSFAFQSPTARAIGIAWQQEIMARLQHHLITTTNAANNITLDSSTEYFPLDQSLYFDFSHDTNIVPVLTAFGLKQFAGFLPADGPPDPNRALFISHIVPLGCRLEIEVIKAESPIPADRSSYKKTGPPTTYIHFVLNQRTIPLGKSLPACGQRADGWCEINDFFNSQKDAVKLARFDYACYGNYSSVPYGNITNGAPP